MKCQATDALEDLSTSKNAMFTCVSWGRSIIWLFPLLFVVNVLLSHTLRVANTANSTQSYTAGRRPSEASIRMFPVQRAVRLCLSAFQKLRQAMVQYTVHYIYKVYSRGISRLGKALLVFLPLNQFTLQPQSSKNSARGREIEFRMGGYSLITV